VDDLSDTSSGNTVREHYVEPHAIREWGCDDPVQHRAVFETCQPRIHAASSTTTERERTDSSLPALGRQAQQTQTCGHTR
jgi:hypothetical protein